MQRVIEPELLDGLPAEDLGAMGSRRDLRALNACMGNARIMARVLGCHLVGLTRRHLVELGAGDGEFLLSTARRLKGWSKTSATLVDQQNLLSGPTRQRFAALGWQVEGAQADVFAWLKQADAQADAILANLFLHHFRSDRLSELLRRVAMRTHVFIALEPRRAPLSFAFSRMVGLIGCNAVTRHDAPVSVRAGFRAKELSALWPPEENWQVQERSAGPFSHLFIARRVDARCSHTENF